MREKLSVWSLLAGVLAAALAASPLAAHARDFTWAAPSDGLSFDPHALNDTFSQAQVNNVYEALVRHSAALKIEPALAVSWETPEPTRWRFHLRQGVTFHDGRPFTADDVVFTWQRTQTPGALAIGKLDAIKAVTKIDDLTVDIELKRPFPILLQSITNWFMMSRGWAEENSALTSTNAAAGVESPANRRANGTGPFILVSRDPGVRNVMRRNPAWWDTPRHNLDTVTFEAIANDATRTAALLSGGVDAILPVPLQDIARVEHAAGFQLLQRPELRSVYFGFDLGDKEIADSNVRGRNPFQDRRVRQAFYQAIDVEAIRSRIMRGASAPAGIIVAPEINGYDASLNTRLPFDPEAARKLLAEAGYGGGFEVGLDCPTAVFVNDEAICRAIIPMLSRIGVTLRPNIENRALWSTRLANNNVAFYMMGHAGLPTIDAYSTLSEVMATPAGALGGLNAGKYSNPLVDALIAKVSVEGDPAVRQGLISQALGIVKEDIGFIPLHQQPLIWGARAGVTLVQTPDNRFRLWLVRAE